MSEVNLYHSRNIVLYFLNIRHVVLAVITPLNILLNIVAFRYLLLIFTFKQFLIIQCPSLLAEAYSLYKWLIGITKKNSQNLSGCDLQIPLRYQCSRYRRVRMIFTKSKEKQETDHVTTFVSVFCCFAVLTLL